VTKHKRIGVETFGQIGDFFKKRLGGQEEKLSPKKKKKKKKTKTEGLADRISGFGGKISTSQPC